MQIQTFLAASLIASLGCLAIPTAALAEANFPGVDALGFPFWVVKDQDGLIGQVFGYDANGPVTQFKDGDREFYTIIRAPDRLITNTTIGYTTNDCTGVAYLSHPDSAGGWFQLLGATYAYRGTGAGTILYRAESTDLEAPVTTNSRWSNSNDNCIGNGISNPVLATEVDVHINFPVMIE